MNIGWFSQETEVTAQPVKLPLTRAAVFDPETRSWTWQELRPAGLAPGELLVEVLCCTLCGSDLHFYSGRRPLAGPTTLGHEILGRVVNVGPEYAGPCRVGQRVTWSLCASCGSCFFCRHQLPQKCDRLFKYGHEVAAKAPLGGGLATHCLVRQGTTVLPVPEELSDELATPANCATATVAAAFREAGSCAGRTVVITGAGMLGLTAAAWARFQNADTVIVADPEPRRAQLAEKFGATLGVQLTGAAAQIVDTAVAQATAGRGADLFLDFSGAAAAVRNSFDLCRTGGQVVLVGSVLSGEPISLEPDRVVRQMLTIRGVHNYRPEDLATSLEFLAASQDRFRLADLVEASFPLERVDEAFQCAIKNRMIRVAVRP